MRQQLAKYNSPVASRQSGLFLFFVPNVGFLRLDFGHTPNRFSLIELRGARY